MSWRSAPGTAQGANLLLIGGPGGGKTHLASAIGLALVENGWRVLFARTSDLVQRLQVARRELALEAAINRLDRFNRHCHGNRVWQVGPRRARLAA